LKENNILIEYAQTQFNTVLDNEVVKLHGDPTINHHDWVIVDNAGKTVICHILCFVTVSDVPKCSIFPVGSLMGPGQYATCHFVDHNIFLNDKPKDLLYGHGNNFISYQTDENCSLV